MKISKNIYSAVLSLMVAFMLTSCEYETIQPEKAVVITPGTVVKFSEKVLPVFSKYNCTACHPSTKNLDFTTANAYNSVKTVVDVANPSASVFYVKISSTHNGIDLTSTEKAYILEWIKEGALNN